MALLIEMLILVVVLVGIALVAVGRGGALREDDPDRVDTRVPAPGQPVLPESVDAIRFGMAFRGYRMDEVDDALDRLRDEIAVLRAHLHTPAAEVLPVSAAASDAEVGEEAATIAPAKPTSRFAPIDSPSTWTPPPAPAAWQRRPEPEPVAAAESESEPQSEPAPAPAAQSAPEPQDVPEPVGYADAEPVSEPDSEPEPRPDAQDETESDSDAGADETLMAEPAATPSWAQWAPATAPLEATPEHAEALPPEPEFDEAESAGPSLEEAWALDPLQAPQPPSETAEPETAEPETAQQAAPEAGHDAESAAAPADHAPEAAAAPASGWEGSAPIPWEREEQAEANQDDELPASPTGSTLPPDDETPRA